MLTFIRLKVILSILLLLQQNRSFKLLVEIMLEGTHKGILNQL